MANYTLTAGDTRPVIDGNGVQLTSASATVQSFDDVHVALAFDPTAPHGLTITGRAAGSGPVTVNGVTHTVTVVEPPFDWSIG